MNKKITFIVIACLLLIAGTMVAQKIIRRPSAKFIEVSSLDTQDKRMNWFRQQTPQVKAEVRLAHVEQLKKQNTYSPEQLNHLSKLNTILTPEMYSQALSKDESKPLVDAVNAWCKEARSLFTAEHLTLLSTEIGTNTEKSVSLEGDEPSPIDIPCEAWDEQCLAGRNCKCNGSSWCQTCYDNTQCTSTDCCCGCFGCCGCNRTGKIE